MLILAPLELVLCILVFLGTFWLFRRLLNSKKVDKVINEVVHPTIQDDDAVIEDIDRVTNTAKKRIAESDIEIARRRKRKSQIEDRIRRPDSESL